MENKTLKRIIKKTLGATDRDEFVAALAGLSSETTDNLVDAVDQIDKAFNDLDRVIDIRDRSLALSSKELTQLNSEISETANKQKAILEQLQAILQLLKADQGESGANSAEDLGQLVSDVDRLVKSQLNAAKNLKVLFEEGLKVSSVLSFKALEIQLQASIRTVTAPSAEVRIYFSGQLLNQQDQIAYFSCDDHNEAAERLDLTSEDQITGFNFLNINSAKGHGTLAIVRIKFGSNQPSDLLIPQIQPLLPNVGATLENIRLLQEEKRKQHLENELQTARFVQQTLLPPPAPKISSDIEVSGYYQSANECGGDWWSYFTLEDGRHVVLVGDVTGHGTASAMVVAVVKGYCDSIVDRKNLTLASLLSELNRVVFRLSRDGKRAMTMAAVAIDPKKGEVQFANAGHPHPIVLRSGPTPATNYLINSGSILGIAPDAEYEEKIFPFHKGDQLVFYTDGVTECTSRKKEMYGERRLRSVLNRTSPGITAAELNKTIIQDLKTFYANAAPEDDITTVVVKNINQVSA